VEEYQQPSLVKLSLNHWTQQGVGSILLCMKGFFAMGKFIIPRGMNGLVGHVYTAATRGEQRVSLQFEQRYLQELLLGWWVETRNTNVMSGSKSDKRKRKLVLLNVDCKIESTWLLTTIGTITTAASIIAAGCQSFMAFPFKHCFGHLEGLVTLWCPSQFQSIVWDVTGERRADDTRLLRGVIQFKSKILRRDLKFSKQLAIVPLA
jgi:hypothetical protein